MAMHWGSKYIAVTAADPAMCRVEIVSMKPSPLSTGITEATFLPVPEGMEQYQVHDTELSARTAIKRHILDITHDPIVERAACLANVALKAEKLRFEKSGNYKERIEELKWIEAKVKAEIRELKSIRRRKIETL